jgi:predicted RecB family nuclease
MRSRVTIYSDDGQNHIPPRRWQSGSPPSPEKHPGGSKIMKITSNLFDAFLKCPTKCYLRSTGQTGAGNAYAEWVREQNDGYRKEAVQRLVTVAEGEAAVTSPDAADLKTATWRLALDFPLETGTMASRLHAVERGPSQGRGRPAQFVPVRFTFFNKLTKDDRLLVAFDTLVLSEVLGREVSVGKIIHGDDHATLKVKVSSLLGIVRKLTGKGSALLANGSPPDLILKRHCGECEFRDHCRPKAQEKDELSLLGGMTEKERKSYHNKGIFTVTQLSYTFRPRRRPRRLREKRERYHHSLKALAIREKKIHIVGSPELKIEGTPVYFDVEGLPDRDFYYLIGARVIAPDSVVERSFWADRPDEEKSAWNRFIDMLADIQNPILIHYGSYETKFLKNMCERYGQPPAESVLARAINSAVNVLSLIFAQVYFPTYSNGLKEISGYVGFPWPDPNPSGLMAIMWRHEWERTGSLDIQNDLIRYNTGDCAALEKVTAVLFRLGKPNMKAEQGNSLDSQVTDVDLLPRNTLFGRFSTAISEFEQANKAARWDYQRDRIYARASRRIRKSIDRARKLREKTDWITKTIVLPDQPLCPNCGGKGYRHFKITSQVLHDLFFGKHGLKRWVVEYRFHCHWCPACKLRYGMPPGFWPDTKFGRNLVAYILYQCIELFVKQRTVRSGINRLFGLNILQPAVYRLKARAAIFYKETQMSILERIKLGDLVHVDETRANAKGRAAYVWVFTNLHEVVYLYSDSREGDIAQATLSGFGGVLISDFYSVYDSFSCPQQKCLLHLMRDLNAEMLRNPYDEDLKRMIIGFAQRLKEVVETVDRFGLKKHFLHKHHRSVDRFYRQITSVDPQSEAAIKCKQRFEKNQGKLFTFLDYDDVSWNNNNAEHAIKAFAALRDVMEGSSTQKGIEEYLVLLSVCQTCKYMGVDFLDFLRSGEKDIHAFAESRRGRGRRSPINEPKALPADDGAQE